MDRQCEVLPGHPRHAGLIRAVDQRQLEGVGLLERQALLACQGLPEVLPEQSSVPPRSDFFVAAFRVVASGAGVDVAEAEDSIVAAVGMAVWIQLGVAELGTGPGGLGRRIRSIAEPLLVPLMINATATASTIVAPKTSARRTQ